MKITDLTVEVRNSSLARVGQLLPGDLVGAKFIQKFNNIGSWSVKLPNGHVMADALRTPGAGLIVTLPDGKIISGPTISAKLEQSISNTFGDWTIEGGDDSIILSERLGYPVPSTDDVTAQTSSAYDVRSGIAETVIKGYVNANLVSGPVSRRVPNLIIETDGARGNTVKGQARFDVLQDLLYPIAQTGGIGYTIDQVDSDLVFKVYEPVDRTGIIRMDLQNGKLSKADYAYLRPKVTRAIVGGSGEAQERLFYEGSNAVSLEAENVWGRRVEVFVDNRGSNVNTELAQSAAEALVDNGKTIVNLNVTPSDDQNMRYGFDWGLGDIVTVVVGDTEASAVVNTVGISVEVDGVRVSAEVGTPTPLSFESKLVSASNSAAQRISALERNTTGYGISTNYQPGGGTNGTQPVFPASAVVGSYTRFGNMIHFTIKVTFTNITSFGTGRYYLTLPYNSSHAYFVRAGCLHDASAGTTYSVGGHINEGSNVLELYAQDKVASGVQDVAFTSTFPVTLTTADSFHISGSYEIEG